MASSNPFTAISLVVARAITDHQLFVDLKDAGRIQVFDRSIDVRGEIEESPDLGKRIWIEPVSSDPKWNFSSGSTKIDEQYRIGFGNGDMKLEEIELLRWNLWRALATLSNLRHPDETPIVDGETNPFQLQSIIVGGGRPERDPLSDPQEWKDEILVTVTAFVATNLIPIPQ